MIKAIPPSFAVLALMLNTVLAAPADVPETGQQACFNVAGDTINCTGTGQDGELRAGVEVPNPRFVLGRGAQSQCVIDRLTGLTWVQTPDGVTRTWTDALAYAEDFTLCGFDDWRLPSVNELESLVNFGARSQRTALNASVFDSVPADGYWSSTTFAADPVRAWRINMNDGAVSSAGKTSTNHAWPVRGGQ